MIKCCPSLQLDIAWEHVSQPAVKPKSCAKVLTFNKIEKFYAVFYSFLTLYLILSSSSGLNVQVRIRISRVFYYAMVHPQPLQNGTRAGGLNVKIYSKILTLGGYTIQNAHGGSEVLKRALSCQF